MRVFYLLLTVAGVVVPLNAFAPSVATHGLDAHLFVRELFGNRVSTFSALDVLLSAVVVIGMARRDGRALRLWWLPIVMTPAVGVSAGLPCPCTCAKRDRQGRSAATCRFARPRSRPGGR